MEVLSNPFNTLGVSPRDTRHRIAEVAEERALLEDPDQCLKARSDLTNPRKRLAAEVAWLPGVGPSRSAKLVEIVASPRRDLLTIENISALARANIIATGLSRISGLAPGEIGEWVLQLAFAFDDIDSLKLLDLLNQERVVSGFPEISDLSSVQGELDQRRRYYRSVIKSALDGLGPNELVSTVTTIVDLATDNGEVHGPVLIDDLVDAFEVEAHEFLQAEHGNIERLVESIREDASNGTDVSKIDAEIDRLIDVVHNWDRVAQPIQVNAQSRGLPHEASYGVAFLVRSLAIDLFNDYQLLEQSQRITTALQDAFAEVAEVAEKTAEDAEALEDIADQREQMLAQAKAQTEEWRREITYEADVGAIFKDKLRISPEGIDWKSRHWDLDEITRVRWGGTKHSVNGIPTGTTYSILFGNNQSTANIELKKQVTYDNFVERLWKAVCVRLMTEFLETLGNGDSLRIGTSVIRDTGIELQKKKFLSKSEKVFLPWSEVVIWNGAGCFVIGSKNDKKLAEAYSYQEQDNIHVLEALIRLFWKRGGSQLSSLLDG